MEKKIELKVTEIKEVHSRGSNQDKDYETMKAKNDHGVLVTITAPESYFDGLNPKDDVEISLKITQQTLETEE